jgi:hypothetical protein
MVRLWILYVKSSVAVILRIDELVVYTTIPDVGQAFELTKCG